MAHKIRGIIITIILLPFFPFYFALKRLFKDPEEVEFDRIERHQKDTEISKKNNEAAEKFYTRTQYFLQKTGTFVFFDLLFLFLASNPASSQESILGLNLGGIAYILFLSLSCIGGLRYIIIIIYKLTENYRNPVKMHKKPKYLYHYWNIQNNGFQIRVFTNLKTGIETLGIMELPRPNNFPGIWRYGERWINPGNGEELTREEIEIFNNEFTNNSNPDEITRRIIKETNRSYRLHGMKFLSDYSPPKL